MRWQGIHRYTGVVDVSAAAKIGFGGDYALAGGRTYYTDDNGSDGSRGLNPEDPLKTTTAAIAKCVSGNGDAVVCMARSPSTPVTGETWPISLNKTNMLLTGLFGRGGLISDSGFGATPTNTHCLTVAANFVTVENLYLQVTTGTTGDVIGGLTASRYGFTLRNSWIGLQNTARYGLGIVTWDMPYLLVEDCRFSAPNAASMTTAIYFGGNATFSHVRRNTFFECSSYAIHGVGVGNCAITDNDFDLYSDTAGFAIHMAATTDNNYLARNYAGYGLADTAANPYQDLATDGKNNWVMNYKGDDVTYPATS